MPKGDTVEMYCGTGPVPKGKVRATPEYCVQNKQVRYYGIVALSKELAEKAAGKGKAVNLAKEQEKQGKLLIKVNGLRRRELNLKVIIDNPDEREKKRKAAEKELAKVLEQKQKALTEGRKQEALVNQLIAEKKKELAEAAKAKEKAAKEKEKAKKKAAKEKEAAKRKKTAEKKPVKKASSKTTTKKPATKKSTKKTSAKKSKK